MGAFSSLRPVKALMSLLCLWQYTRQQLKGAKAYGHSQFPGTQFIRRGKTWAKESKAASPIVFMISKQGEMNARAPAGRMVCPCLGSVSCLQFKLLQTLCVSVVILDLVKLMMKINHYSPQNIAPTLCPDGSLGETVYSAFSMLVLNKPASFISAYLQFVNRTRSNGKPSVSICNGSQFRCWLWCS